MSREKPPNPDEFEVSIIGPGRGECVVVHLGNNEWCVVDSCIPRGAREPAALEYLGGFHNEAIERIRLIVATHWHDDHIRGLASMLGQAPGAAFFCSAALESGIFFELVGTAAAGIQGRSGVDEFASILGLIEEASGAKAKRIATPKWAIENRKLRDFSEIGRPFRCSVTALSPSDGTMRLALQEIGQLLPKVGERQGRVASLSPNHTSVALWIQAGPVRALLGADLLHTGREGEGWMAVLASHQDAERAVLFKVPHHGSVNADCPEVWSRMLIDNPIAVVTPFSGGKKLPQPSDLRRLSGRTTNLYCTAAGAGKPPSRDPLVEKTVRRVAADRHVVEGQPGHVRVRWQIRPGAPAPTIETFSGAYRVN